MEDGSCKGNCIYMKTTFILGKITVIRVSTEMCF